MFSARNFLLNVLSVKKLIALLILLLKVKIASIVNPGAAAIADSTPANEDIADSHSLFRKELPDRTDSPLLTTCSVGCSVTCSV